VTAAPPMKMGARDLDILIVVVVLLCDVVVVVVVVVVVKCVESRKQKSKAE
jgi:heme/copper-type cytochrome/quinol oxidase subunit 2